MKLFRRTDPPGEGDDVHPFWFVGMMALMFWLVSSEPRAITGQDYAPKQIDLHQLPWSWLPALLSWLTFGSLFAACRAEVVEEWSDLDRTTIAKVAVGVLWRVAVWGGIAAGSVVLCGALGLSYAAPGWIVIGAVILNAVIGFFRRKPKDLWD